MAVLENGVRMLLLQLALASLQQRGMTGMMGKVGKEEKSFNYHSQSLSPKVALGDFFFKIYLGNITSGGMTTFTIFKWLTDCCEGGGWYP